MIIKKPIIKRPESEEELRRVKTLTEARIEDIKKRESELKKEYSSDTIESKNRIKVLQEQLKREKYMLSRTQTVNRRERRYLANDRIRLQYDLNHLNSRFSSFVSGGRKKVSTNPEVAFELMDKKRSG